MPTPIKSRSPTVLIVIIMLTNLEKNFLKEWNYVSDRNFYKWFVSQIGLTYCEKKNVLVIENIFLKSLEQFI